MKLHRTCAAVVAALCIGMAPAGADGVADFYRGKTVQLVIPSNMGGSVGLYGKLVTDHIGRHIPGNPTVILIQMPGAGGLQSVEFIAQVAPKDGTAIAEILSPSLLVPLLRNTRFDSGTLQWLGSLTARPGVVGVWHTAAATTLEGARKVELVMGSTGVGSGNYWIPTLANAVLGTKFKLVPGYRGGADINLAIERREIDGRSNYWTGWTTVKPDWIREGKLKFGYAGPAVVRRAHQRGGAADGADPRRARRRRRRLLYGVRHPRRSRGGAAQGVLGDDARPEIPRRGGAARSADRAGASGGSAAGRGVDLCDTAVGDRAAQAGHHPEEIGYGCGINFRKG
jgi:hypothetical protein